MKLKDIKELRRLLDAAGPRPWEFDVRGIDGHVADANGNHLFGGESCEGAIEETDPGPAAVVKMSQHIDELLKIAKKHLRQKR